MNVHWRATVPLEDKQLRDFWTPLQFHMGFESVPWVDIWPSKNCCAKSFACLIHGDPLIRCSKGWPMAHFYHHSFAFAETPRASSPGRTTVKQKVDAPDCGRRAKKSCHSYRSNFFNTFQLQCVFFSVWMSSRILPLLQIQQPNHYYESCGLGTSPPLGTMILRNFLR